MADKAHKAKHSDPAKHADPAKVALQDALDRLREEVAGGTINRATLDTARNAIEAMAHKLDGGALPPGSWRRNARK